MGEAHVEAGLNATWATGPHMATQGPNTVLAATVPWTAASARCCLVLLCLHLLRGGKRSAHV
jgi:hypothetical protein